MRIEEGKKYITRDGRVTDILIRYGKRPYEFCYKNNPLVCYTRYGLWLSDFTIGHPLDVVAEYYSTDLFYQLGIK